MGQHLGLKSKALAIGSVMACAVSWAMPAAASDDLRTVETERLLVIETSRGMIYVEMNPDIAPGHVERIRRLAGEGFYDGVKWHRVIDGFMAQTGDPTGTGDGASSYENLKAELTFRRGPDTNFRAVARPMGIQLGFMDSIPVLTQPDHYWQRSSDGKVHAWATYCPGVAGMARDDPEDSANSQFFLMRAAYPSLDKRYTIWGRVVSGQDVVNSLKDSPLQSGMVDDPDIMVRVRAADQMPASERPVVRVGDTRSETFAREIEALRELRGADFSVCDVEIRAVVTLPGQ